MVTNFGPRVGFAWDINGDGKQALRASGGTFARRFAAVRPHRGSGRSSTAAASIEQCLDAVLEANEAGAACGIGSAHPVVRDR